MFVVATGGGHCGQVQRATEMGNQRDVVELRSYAWGLESLDPCMCKQQCGCGAGAADACVMRQGELAGSARKPCGQDGARGRAGAKLAGHAAGQAREAELAVSYRCDTRAAGVTG